jgi:hypothetical protein
MWQEGDTDMVKPLAGNGLFDKVGAGNASWRASLSSVTSAVTSEQFARASADTALQSSISWEEPGLMRLEATPNGARVIMSTDQIRMLDASLQNVKVKGEDMKSKLYQTKSEPVEYGSYLATNSAGHYVLEMKGSGDVRAFDPSEIEEVVPHTVKVNHAASSTFAHVVLPEGKVEVGDVLMINGQFYTVSELNTKQQMTWTDTKIFKVPVEKLT